MKLVCASYVVDVLLALTRRHTRRRGRSPASRGCNLLLKRSTQTLSFSLEVLITCFNPVSCLRTPARQLLHERRAWRRAQRALPGDVRRRVHGGAREHGILRRRWQCVCCSGLSSLCCSLQSQHDHLGNVSAQIAYSQLSARWNFEDFFYFKQFSWDNGSGGRTTMDVIFMDTVVLAGNSDLLENKFDPLQGPADLQVSSISNDHILFLSVSLFCSSQVHSGTLSRATLQTRQQTTFSQQDIIQYASPCLPMHDTIFLLTCLSTLSVFVFISLRCTVDVSMAIHLLWCSSSSHFSKSTMQQDICRVSLAWLPFHGHVCFCRTRPLPPVH